MDPVGTAGAAKVATALVGKTAFGKAVSATALGLGVSMPFMMTTSKSGERRVNWTRVLEIVPLFVATLTALKLLYEVAAAIAGMSMAIAELKADNARLLSEHTVLVERVHSLELRLEALRPHNTFEMMRGRTR